MARRANPGDYLANFRTYDADLVTKLVLAARNTARRFTRRRPCCGHHGEPGC